MSTLVCVSLLPSCWDFLIVLTLVLCWRQILGLRGSRPWMFQLQVLSLLQPCPRVHFLWGGWFSSLSPSWRITFFSLKFESSSEDGCFLTSYFIKPVSCVFLHTWRFRLMWSVNVLYSVWRYWSRRHLHLKTKDWNQTFCNSLVAVKEFAVDFCFFFHPMLK